MKDTYYITTPIYYPSGNWHIGHCYTTVICDALARWHKMLGQKVYFLTGTDEHGQKIEKKAKAAGKQPIELVDPLVTDLKEIWKLLDISYDQFIRTTDEKHVKCVQRLFEELYRRGEIYKAEYEGWYCTPCESFWTEAQLKDGKCPDCGRPVHKEKEESYFFRLSKYADRILKLYEENSEFLQPKSRMNEMINNFLKAGLQDLCISRTSLKWGIPVSFDPDHVVYVWVDALANYISALGYGTDDPSLYETFWPADLHLVGKEIVRFHAIVWPALLMALDLPVPKQVYGHGWLLIGGDKLSKSKGDLVRTELVDPHQLAERYGSDAVRYFLLREIPFGSDGIYTNESLLNRINFDLANDLGNLVSRTTAMIVQYFGGVLPAAGDREGPDDELIAMAESLFDRANAAMEALNAPEALTEIFRLIQRANKYIDETAPWVLAKDESKRVRLGTVLYHLSECIRIAAVLLKPFLTKAADVILASYSIDGAKVDRFDTVKRFGGLEVGTKVEKLPPIFPRIDLKKEIAEIDKIAAANKKEEKKEVKQEEKKSEIAIDDFGKVDLRVALVVACEKVEKADKLLKLTVRLGEETRTVVSGIAKHYAPEEMVGKRVVMIANLKPVKLRGIESQGMILCAEDEEGNLSLVTPERANFPDGSGIF